MRAELRTIVNEFVASIGFANTFIPNEDSLKLGSSFSGSETTLSLATSVNKNYTKKNTYSRKELVEKGNELKKHLSTENIFLLYVLIFYKRFNGLSRKTADQFENTAKDVAFALGIKKQDADSVIEFFNCNEAYTDRNKALYLEKDDKAKSIKQLGSTIIAHQNNSDCVTYLKYFKTYKLFLSKVFFESKNPYHFLEKLKAKEINFINETNMEILLPGCDMKELAKFANNATALPFFEMNEGANTPKVVLDPNEGKVILSGSSSPFSPTGFFEPIVNWVKSYADQIEKPLEIYIMFNYFNTYTSKFLVKLAKVCDDAIKNGHETKIFWYCDPEDEEMLDFGSYLKDICKKGVQFCLTNDGLEIVA